MASIEIGTVLVALGTLIVSVAIWRRYLSTLRDIPGPALASITRFWHVRHVIKGDQNRVLVRAHDKYGHFVRIAPGEVSVSHPDGPRKILLATLHKADWYKIATFPDGRFLNPFAATDPKIKNELSRHVAPAYTLSNVLQSEEAINNTIALLLGWLDKFAASHEPVRLDEFVSFTTSDVVGEVVFSKPFGFLKKGADIGGAFAASEAQSAYVSATGFFRWIHVLLLANPVVTWLGIVPWGHIVDTAMGAIKERQANPDGRFDASSHWFRMLKQNPDRMHRHEIDSAAFNAVAAGSDTVSSGVQAFLYFMMRHPDAWRRARQEMEDAGLEEREGVISFADTQGLPYLQACLKEALRIFGPGAMGLARRAPPGGLEIGGQTFPEGTILSVHPWVIHHSKEIWGNDAREFNPDRWLSGAAAAKLDKDYMPFGLGYASCPGQNLARLEMAKIGATLVLNYDIRQVNPKQEMRYKAFFSLIAHMPPCYVERVRRSS
ncbi:cytochrome P450 E-class group I [Apiospora arundinis]|uniref:Cytochrome P450 E-class group I n=1 Tax=Apiospora arundinis TaxID=335852 RepID=A0ABR2IRU6_9PEZI